MMQLHGTIAALVSLELRILANEPHFSQRPPGPFTLFLINILFSFHGMFQIGTMKATDFLLGF